MSVYSDLFVYLDAQWSDRTKIVFPNTQNVQHSGSYTDSTSVLEVTVLDVGSRTLTAHVEGTSPREDFYILQCNIIAPKNVGFGTAYDHMDQLDSIFRNQNFTQGSFSYNFEESQRAQPVPDDAWFIIPWTCPFFVFVN